MKKIWQIALKDNLVRFSSWSELLFFLVLPIIFSVFLSGTLGQNAVEEVSRIPVYIVDEDGSTLSADFRRLLENGGVVEPMLGDAAGGEAAFAAGDVAVLLTLPAGFEADLQAGRPLAIQMQSRASGTGAAAAEQAIFAAAANTEQALAVAAASVAEAEAIAPFTDDEARSAYFSASLAAAREQLAAQPARVNLTQSDKATTEAGIFDVSAYLAAGQLVTWVFIPLLGTSGIYAMERTQGTLRRLVTTPTRRLTFMGGTIFGQLGAAIIQMILLIAIGSWLGINWGNNYWALGLMVFTFGLAGVALGTMLATFIRTAEQANGVSVLLGMTMALMGGCWFPLENFPEVAQQAAQALPTTWAMRGFTDIVVRGQGVAAILPEVGILLGFTVLFLVIGSARFRYE